MIIRVRIFTQQKVPMFLISAYELDLSSQNFAGVSLAKRWLCAPCHMKERCTIILILKGIHGFLSMIKMFEFVEGRALLLRVLVL